MNQQAADLLGPYAHLLSPEYLRQWEVHYADADARGKRLLAEAPARHMTPGSIVVLRNGWTEMLVLALTYVYETQQWIVTAAYSPDAQEGSIDVKVRSVQQFITVEEFGLRTHISTLRRNITDRFTPQKGTTTMTTPLYTWTTKDSGDQFGTLLAQGSDGLWVMEVKGTGALAKVDPKVARKVLPYSVAVVYGGESKRYHFKARKDSGLVPGSRVLMDDGRMVTVVAVDTQSEMATRWLTGFVLQGTVLTADTAED